MKKIKRIGILHTALALSIIMLIIKVITGIIAVIALQVPAVQSAVSSVDNLGVLSEVLQAGAGVSALVLIIVAPILSFIATFIAVVILAWLYNIVAKKWAITLDM